MRYQRLVFFTLIAFLLSACAAPFIAGAAVGGLVVNDQREIAAIHEDNSLRTSINERIQRDPAFKDSHIIVSSFNNVVLLAGQTPHASLRVSAGKIARSFKGVKKVYNEITLGSPSSQLTRGSDVWITTKVKGLMVAQKGLHSSQVKVVTENGTVYLMGDVSRRQAKMATALARRVEGVQQVVKIFNYVVT